MRFRTRKAYSWFSINRAPIVKTISIIFLLWMFIKLISYGSQLSTYQNHYYMVPKQPNQLGRSFNLTYVSNNVSLSVWRMFSGYGGTRDNARTHPEDPSLEQKLVSAHKFFKHPLFQIRRNGSVVERHPWKFEKIIHQTWIDQDIPGRTVPWVKKWLEVNPDWTYIFWTDEKSREFISEHFPSLLAVYDSWTIPVQKADMFRYIALYAFGGIYADLDMEALKSLEEMRNWSSCVLSREPEVQTYIMSNILNCWANNFTFTCNAFMGCRSHHPFLLYVIGRVVQLSPLVRGFPCHLNSTIACTGPWMMSFAYGYYRRSITEERRAANRQLGLICPEFEWFLPTFDETRLKLVQQGCHPRRRKNRKQKQVCDTWIARGSKNEPMDYSITNHHWFHSYHYNVNTDKVNINGVTKNVRWSSKTQYEDFYITRPVKR